jgi:hypothetical protein
MHLGKGSEITSPAYLLTGRPDMWTLFAQNTKSRDPAENRIAAAKTKNS